jgi:hypothetical protein
MSGDAATGPNTALPSDLRALVAIDLGAESCRVSLLRWESGSPAISLVHRFVNNPRHVEGGLRWDLACIESGLDTGLRRCAELATEGIRSIAVDGWAVDYVLLDAQGVALSDPFCYRDERSSTQSLKPTANCAGSTCRSTFCIAWAAARSPNAPTPATPNCWACLTAEPSRTGARRSSRTLGSTWRRLRSWSSRARSSAR